MMKTGALGLRLIMVSEGCYLTAYRCPAGQWTIGYGHTAGAGAPSVFAGMTITQEQAGAILQADLELFEGVVNRLVKVKLTQDQFDALVSITENIGEGAFRKSSLLRKVNAEDWRGATTEFLRWDHCKGKVLPGLAKRRHAEAALFSGNGQEIVATMAHSGPHAHVVDAPKDHPATVTRTVGTIAAAGATGKVIGLAAVSNLFDPMAFGAVFVAGALAGLVIAHVLTIYETSKGK